MQKAQSPLLLPEPPANLSNDDTVATPLSEIGRTQAINLTNQNNTNLRLEKLQQWVTEQKAEWEKAKKKKE